MRGLPAWVPLLALLLAGCSTPDDAPAAETANAVAEDPPVEAAREPTEEGNATVAPAPTSHPFEWQGYFRSGAHIQVGGPVPTFVSVTPMGTDVIEEIVPDAVQAVDLTMTWTATSPTTEQMFFLVTPYTSCGVNCYEFIGNRLPASGTSPLRTTGNLTLADADGAAVFVYPLNSLPTPDAYATIVVDQAWTVSGTVLA